MNKFAKIQKKNAKASCICYSIVYHALFDFNICVHADVGVGDTKWKWLNCKSINEFAKIRKKDAEASYKYYSMVYHALFEINICVHADVGAGGKMQEGIANP